MNVIILGSRGFIGSSLVRHFLDVNFSVFGCDLLEFSGKEYSYQKVSIHSSDFETIFAKHAFDVCINASGSGNVGFSIDYPISDFESNSRSVIKVLDTIRKFQPQCKYVHISSAAVYGNPDLLPIKESSRLAPLSPYGYHKWISELVCREYREIYGLKVIILRPFSVYGEGLRKQLLWDICNRLRMEDTIQLFGTGNESRDFIHCLDLAKLIDLLTLKADFAGEVYNAASGVETTIREIAAIVEHFFQGRKKITFSGVTRNGDPLNWKADISGIVAHEFSPSVPLEVGVRNYIKWFVNTVN